MNPIVQSCFLTKNGLTKTANIIDKTAKRDGNRLIGQNLSFQQDGARSHTSKVTIEAIKSMGFSLIGSDIWPLNSPDLNPLIIFFEKKKKYN